MLIRTAKGETHFIDYREKAPARATADMYLDERGNVLPNASVIGYKAIAVPGSVAGLVYAGKKYGRQSNGFCGFYLFNSFLLILVVSCTVIN